MLGVKRVLAVLTLLVTLAAARPKEPKVPNESGDKNTILIEVTEATIEDVELGGNSVDGYLPGKRGAAQVVLDEGQDISTVKTMIFKGVLKGKGNNGQGPPLVFKNRRDIGEDPADEVPGVWRGVLNRNNMLGFATLYQDPKGGLAGSIYVEDVFYAINTMPDGSVVFRTTLSEDLDAERREGDESGGFEEAGQDRRNLRITKTNEKTLKNPVAMQHNITSGRHLQFQAADNVIHHLVVVEHAAMCAEAGQSPSCRSTEGNRRAMQRRLRIAEDDLNDALATAGTAVRVRMIDIYWDQSDFKSSAYRDNSDRRSDSQIRDNLVNPDDRVLDHVHWIRDMRGADIVTLITNNGGPGVAAIKGDSVSWDMFAAQGFQIVRRDRLSDWTMTHEMGHLLRCLHDRDNAITDGSGNYVWPSGVYATRSNYGYSNPTYFVTPLAPNIGLKSVMAYDCDTSKLGSERTVGLTCIGMKYFSSATIPLPGTNIIMGDSYNDNAAEVRRTAQNLANFRPAASFSIINTNSGKAIDISGWGDCRITSNAQLWDSNREGGQTWHFDNSDMIVLDVCDMALDISYASCSLGTNLQLVEKNSIGAQRFRYDPATGMLWSDFCSNKVVDIAGPRVNGANIRIWDNKGSGNQDWQLQWRITRDSPTFSIVNSVTNMALDVRGWANCQSGSGVQLWDRNGSGGQLFFFNTDGQIALNHCGGNLVLDLYGGSCNDGSLIQVKNKDDQNTKGFWYNEKDSTIVSLACNKVVDTFGDVVYAGRHTVLWSIDGQDNQQWKLVWSN